MIQQRFPLKIFIKIRRFLKNRTRWLKVELFYFLNLLIDGFLFVFEKVRPGKKRVLLVIKNQLGVRVFTEFHEILADRKDITFFATESPIWPGSGHIIQDWCCQNQIQYLRFSIARYCLWSLIVFADHDDMARHSLFLPKLRIPHGISGFKVVDGVPYRHAKKWVEYRRRIFYAKMFEASEYSVELSLIHNRDLEGITVAVGDLCVDRLLYQSSKADTIRTSLGYTKQDFVVLVQSTYGPASLFEWIGRQLVEKCIDLTKQEKWKFIFQTHPHHWVETKQGYSPHAQLLIDQKERPGIHIVGPRDDFVPYMVASDMVITDHTSLFMTYASLNKPILFVDVPGATLCDKSPGKLLSQILTKFTGINNLIDDMLLAKENFPNEKVSKVTNLILSYPGEAVCRVRKEVLQLLDITE